MSQASNIRQNRRSLKQQRGWPPADMKEQYPRRGNPAGGHKPLHQNFRPRRSCRLPG